MEIYLRYIFLSFLSFKFINQSTFISLSNYLCWYLYFNFYTTNTYVKYFLYSHDKDQNFGRNVDDLWINIYTRPERPPIFFFFSHLRQPNHMFLQAIDASQLQISSNWRSKLKVPAIDDYSAQNSTFSHTKEYIILIKIH